MQLRLIGLTLQSNLGLTLQFVLVTAMHVIIMLRCGQNKKSRDFHFKTLGRDSFKRGFKHKRSDHDSNFILAVVLEKDLCVMDEG